MALDRHRALPSGCARLVPSSEADVDTMLGKPRNGTLPTGKEVVEIVRKHYDTAIISFSMGKDSLAAWVNIHGKFKTIIPYYLYIIPDLGFIQRSIKYYEWKFGVRIRQMPHPSMYRLLNNSTFQHPRRVPVIEAAELHEPDYPDVNRWIAEDAGLDDVLTATGVRAADSPIRRMAFTKHGVINWNRRIFYPVWDWTKQDVIDALVTNNISLPVDYGLFGRTFDGIDLRFLIQIRQHFPDDYKKILDWYPFAEVELIRYENALRRGYQHKKKQRAGALLNAP